MTLLRGKEEGLPYSLSRWTDLPASKWSWFREQLDQGWFVGFNPRTSVPSRWSLAPEEVLGLVFWTRRPRNLIQDIERIRPYPAVVHMTATGWYEVEHGAPDRSESIEAMHSLVDTVGVSRVEWRFSPIPAVPDVLNRFEAFASSFAAIGLRRVYVAFLQDNDLLPEERTVEDRSEILREMAKASHGLDVVVCKDDLIALRGLQDRPENLKAGVCESGRRFVSDGLTWDGCGCAQTVDPFCVTESCSMGCQYCYAASREISHQKRDTTER